MNFDRFATEEVDDKRKAAGILAISMETGRMLLALRPKEQCYAGVGGYLTYGEEYGDGAIREFVEETLYDGDIILLRGYHHRDPLKNFEYVNFIGLVPQEFEPMLDQENLEAEWFTLSQVYGGGLPLLNNFENFLFESKPLIESLFQTLNFLNE